MSYLLSILVFLLIFSVLILIHEFGHFYAAKRAGVKVEEFGMGLPPRMKTLYKDRHGTIYSLNWIPFGGFVRMYGEDSDDPSLNNKEGSFGSKSVLARSVIILGGVLMNFLLGYLLLVILLTIGTKPFVVNKSDFDYYRDRGVITANDRVAVLGLTDETNSPTDSFQKNDFFEEISGQPVRNNKDVVETALSHKGQIVAVTVKRGKEIVPLQIRINDEGKMGLQIAEVPEIIDVKEISYPLQQALYQAGYQTVRLSYLTMEMFGQVLLDLVTKAELSPQVSGPVGIAQITHETTQKGDFKELLKLIALLSISLGAINVLPIPALDGGRFLSIAYEMITRRRPNATWEARIHAIGFLLLIALILGVTYHDIVKLIWG